MRCKLQPNFGCADCTHMHMHTHAHAHTHMWHMQLQLHRLSEQVQWHCQNKYSGSVNELGLCKVNQGSSLALVYRPSLAESLNNGCHGHAMWPRASLLSSLCQLGPTDNDDKPQVLKWDHFPQKQEKSFMPSSMFHCPRVVHFLFHRRAVWFQSQGLSNLMNNSQSMSSKHFGPLTQLCRSSSNCLNRVSEVKVHPIKNKWNSPNFFRFAEQPELGSRSKCLSN